MGGMMVAGPKVKEETLMSGNDMKGLAGEGTSMGGMIVPGPRVMGAMLMGLRVMELMSIKLKADVGEKRRKGKACKSASKEI